MVQLTIKARGSNSASISALSAVIVALTMGIAVAILPSAPAAAVDGSTFDPGNIISDQVFFDSDTMSTERIQSFLDSHVTSCKSGFVCLKDYSQDTVTRPADNLCTQYDGAVNESAATILSKVALACNVNPQVLLVLLQKEQGLVTSTSPSNSAYDRATGYGCPDTAACNEQYFGFANQVYRAAAQFIRYGNPPGTSLYFTWYPVGAVTNIRFSPRAACGASPVTIQNKATAALYYYTPYQPNAAALANPHGIGDGCSSYGNRNFWVYFNDWFGSPTLPSNLTAYVKAVYVDVLGRDAGENEPPGWVRAILRGMPRQQVASGFVNSDEYRLLKIDEAYREVLGRAADSGGRMGWLDGMRKKTLKPDDVYRIFLKSEEFYLTGGGTDKGYINALYEKVILRPASDPEQQYWADLIASKGRGWVANAIYNATETIRGRVGQAIELYLGRESTLDERITWASFVKKHDELQFRAAILGSQEYLDRAITRYPVAG